MAQYILHDARTGVKNNQQEVAMGLSAFLSLPLPVMLALAALVLMLLLVGRVVAQLHQPIVVRQAAPLDADAPQPQQG
jgi:hypothetical protein